MKWNFLFRSCTHERQSLIKTYKEGLCNLIRWLFYVNAIKLILKYKVLHCNHQQKNAGTILFHKNNTRENKNRQRRELGKKYFSASIKTFIVKCLVYAPLVKCAFQGIDIFLNKFFNNLVCHDLQSYYLVDHFQCWT